MIAEAFRDFQDAAPVDRIRLGAVLVVLHNQGIHEALGGVAGQALNSTQRVGSSRRSIPVAIRNLLTVGQGYRAERCRQQIGIDCDREVLGVRIDSAERN